MAMPQRVISRETPDSREIEVVVYLPLRKDLWVYFRNGAVSIYFDVDAAAWETFETVESKETFIHALPSCKVLVAKRKPD
jgi:KTSC domain-containing protein